MYLYTFACLLLAVYALQRYFKNQGRYFEKRQIPYIPGWPILGNMASFCFGRQHLSETIHDIYNVDREAKYVGAFNFTSPTIVLRDLELIKSVTIRHFDSFSERQLTIDAGVDPLFGGNLFIMGGELYQQLKHVLTPSFTTSKMKAMHELIAECAESFVNYLTDELPADGRRSVDTKDLFSRVTNDVIVSCAFGIATDSLRCRDNPIYVLGRDATRLDGLPLMKLMLYGVMPRLMKWLRVRFVRKSTADFFIRIMENTVRERDARGVSRADMIQQMMNAREDCQLDATRMTGQAFAFYFGGLDTVSTQLCLLAHELACNPAIQRRLQAEVDEVMQRTNGRPAYEDIQAMTYLDAVFDESTRLHMQFVFLERKCAKPFELPPTLPGRQKFVVQPGMLVWVPAPAINRDPKYHEKPNEFDPDRFLGAKQGEAPNLGFGMGPRGCLGRRFAAMKTKILLAYLCGKFDLRPTERTRTPLEYDKSSLPLRPVGGFFLALEPRRCG